MSGLTLDAGALVAFEKADRRVVAMLMRAVETKTSVAIPAGVLGQVWRDGTRQVRLARLLRASTVIVEALDDFAARAAGQLCGASGTSDVVDASVVLCARRRGHGVLTSDPGDIARLDAALRVVVV